VTVIVTEQAAGHIRASAVNMLDAFLRVEYVTVSMLEIRAVRIELFTARVLWQGK